MQHIIYTYVCAIQDIPQCIFQHDDSTTKTMIFSTILLIVSFSTNTYSNMHSIPYQLQDCTHKLIVKVHKNYTEAGSLLEQHACLIAIGTNCCKLHMYAFFSYPHSDAL